MIVQGEKLQVRNERLRQDRGREVDRIKGPDLAMIANLLMRALLLALPSMSVLTGWIAPGWWCFVGISAFLSVYGLYHATAGRPFGRWKPLEL